jgi:DNA-directed RNA polymerase subunit RPC12/RpoP
MTDFRDATIVCPECDGRFQDWIPRDEPARVCVYCGTHVEHAQLAEIDGVWKVTPELRQVA